MRNLSPVCFILWMGLCLSSCGLPEPDTSRPLYAHKEADQMLGSIVGRLEALKQGFETDFDYLRICIETGKPAISDRALVLETKLAYASWLAASGEFDEGDFARFQWVKRSKCRVDDASFAGMVAFADFDKEIHGDNYSQLFGEPVISCGSGSCATTVMTAGWGGPGSLSMHYYSSNPQRWTALKSQKPATTILSPHMEWTNLIDGLEADPAHDKAVLEKLANAYELLLQMDSPSYAALKKFAALLAAYEVKADFDLGFHQEFNAFIARKIPSLRKTYMPHRPALHVLLHEVGHQFGMGHADAPLSSDVDGASATTVHRDGFYTTKQAVMAYGDSYTYLTADDVTGMRSAVARMRKKLKLHR